jgi:hypothetical protein
MSNLAEQLTLPSDHSEDTLFVKRLKESLAGNPQQRGDKLSYTMKISRDRHGKLLAAANKHGMTVTDLLIQYIDQVVPVLQRAMPVDVPGYVQDRRTRAALDKVRAGNGG